MTETQPVTGLQGPSGFGSHQGENKLAQIAAHHEVYVNQVTTWKTQLLEQAAGIFGGALESTADRERIRALHAKIGEFDG
jgi:transposase